MGVTLKANDFIVLFAIFILFFIFRVFIALDFSQPFIFGDELSYKTMAYSFYEYSDFYHIPSEKMAHTVDIPNFLYPLLISFSFYFTDFQSVIKIINVFFVCISIFPVYYILKEYGCKYIWTPIFLILCIPDYNYSVSVMPESLYSTIFLFIFLFAIKSSNDKSIIFTLLCSIFTGFLFLTKPHAVSVVLSLVCFFSVLICINLFRRDIVSALSHSKQLALFLIFVPTSIMVLSYFFCGSFSFGVYSNVAELKKGVDLNAAFLNTIGHVVTICLLYFVPLIFMVRFLISYNFSDFERKEFNFCLLTLLSLLSVLIMVIKYTTDISGAEHYFRLHARYYFYIYPLFIIAFFIFFDELRFKINKLSLFGITCLNFIALIFSALFIYNNHDSVGLVSDNIQFSWVLSFSPWIVMLIFTLVFLLLSLAIFVKRNVIIFSSVIILMSIVSNLGYIVAAKKYHHANAMSDYETTKKIEKRLVGLHDRNVALVQVNGYGILMNTLFWSPFQFNYARNVSDVSTLNAFIPLNTDVLILIGGHDAELPHLVEQKITSNVSFYFTKSSFENIK